MKDYIFNIITFAIILFIAHTGFSQEGVKPNIIFIVTDDLNDYIEELGGLPAVETPNINRITANGTLFTNAECSSPLCCPSRTSFLTGKDAAYTKIYSSAGYKCGNFSQNFTAAKNNDEYFTIPGFLKDSAGYFTYGLNKIFHCYENFQEYDDDTPEACEKSLSWNKIFVYNDSATLSLGVVVEEEGVVGNEWSAINDTLEPYMMDYVAVDSTIKFIQQIGSGEDVTCNKPFFIALGIKKPHKPLYIPEKYFLPEYVADFHAEPFNIPFHFPANSYPQNGIIMPPQPETPFADFYALPTDSMGQNMVKGADDNFIDWADDLSPLPLIDPAYDEEFTKDILGWSKRANCVLAYVAAIKYIDTQIGRLLDSLENYPEIYNNTVIIFISDNGFSLSEKRHWGKRAMWETDVRIPLIISDLRAPEKQICNTSVNLLDVFPTICDLIDVDPPLFANGTNYLDGISLVPLLNNPSASYERPLLSSVTKEANSEGFCFPQYSIRNNRFHYIRYQSNGGGEDVCDSVNSYIEEELYEIGENRDVDPNEWNNLIHNEDYAPMVKYLQQWLPDSSMYGKTTFKVKIQNLITDCFLSYEDTIELNFDTYDSAGTLISPPDGFLYRWSNNLTADIDLNVSSAFNLNTIPEDIFNANNKIIFYLEMLDTISGTILAVDVKYFYIDPDNTPNPTFELLYVEPIVNVSGFSITGNYSSFWWEIDGDSAFFNQTPEEITFDTPAPHTITCYVQYGNNNCIESSSISVYKPLINYFKNEILYVIPNPAHANVTVFQKSGLQGSTLELFDLNGQRVLYFTLGQDAGTNYFNFDASSLENGIYILTIKNETISSSSPLIIMR